MRWPLFLLLPAVLAAGVPGAVTAGMEPPASAEACGRCHRAIHEAWKTSAHARAMESRLFQDALEQAESETDGAVRKLCLGCHAPVAVRTGDLALRSKVAWEGVTCDFCHSIQDVSMAPGNARFKVEFSLVKSGPSKLASSPGHGTVYSPVHSSSATCAPCHDYKNSLGFPVLTTYSEWKESRAAREGKTCQSCHMYRVAGQVVDPRIQRSGEAKVNLHQMPGSHSLEQLNRTISANLLTAREADQLKVAVEVTNRIAGHYVPTGSALRQVVLEVNVESYDGGRFRGERVYRRRVADQQGNPIDREYLAILKGAKVLSDTRLASEEKRTETFSFPVPKGVQARVRADFWYYYSPMARSEAQKRLKFLTVQRLAKPGP